MNEKFYSHSTAIIENPDNIGEGTKIWHFSHVMSNCIIGKNCTIGQNVFISSGANIGNNVKIQNNISIYDGIICEDDVFLGPSAVFTNVINPRSQISRKNEFKKTIIMKGATIGANSTIVCGNNIGKYSLPRFFPSINTGNFSQDAVNIVIALFTDIINCALNYPSR